MTSALLAAPLSLSDFLVDSGSPSTASDDALVSTASTTPEKAAVLLPNAIPPLPSMSSGRRPDHWAIGSGSRTGPFTTDAGGGAAWRSQDVSPNVSAGTSPVAPSFFDSARASTAGPMRSAALAMPVTARHHTRHPSETDTSGLGRSLPNGRHSRRGSGSALSSSPNLPIGFMTGQKPYARPAPMTAIIPPVAGPSSNPPSAAAVASAPWTATAPPSAGLTPIFGPTKLLGQDLGALDFTQIERDLDQAQSEAPYNAILDTSGPPTPAPTPAAHFSRGLTPPSRASPSAESTEDIARDDPLATKLWKFYAKAKDKLPQGQRMENLSWRMGGMKLGQLVADREKSAAPPSPQLRGRTSQGQGRMPFLCVSSYASS